MTCPPAWILGPQNPLPELRTWPPASAVPYPGVTESYRLTLRIQRRDSSYLPRQGLRSAPAPAVPAGRGDGSGCTAPWLATLTPGPRDLGAARGAVWPKADRGEKQALSLGRWGPVEIRGCRVATALSGPAPWNRAPSGLQHCSFLGGRRSCVSPATPAAQSPHPAPVPGPAPASSRPPTGTEGKPHPRSPPGLGWGDRSPRSLPLGLLSFAPCRLNGLYPRLPFWEPQYLFPGPFLF